MILAAVIGFVIIWSLNDNKIQGKGETIVKSKANTYKTSGDLLRALAKADKTVTVGGFAPDPAATLSGGKSVTGPLTWSALPNNPTYMVGVTIFKNNAALNSWNKLSQGLGGVAVVGDNWAISLPTDDADMIDLSKAFAPILASDLKANVSLPE